MNKYNINEIANNLSQLYKESIIIKIKSNLFKTEVDSIINILSCEKTDSTSNCNISYTFISKEIDVTEDLLIIILLLFSVLLYLEVTLF